MTPVEVEPDDLSFRLYTGQRQGGGIGQARRLAADQQRLPGTAVSAAVPFERVAQAAHPASIFGETGGVRLRRPPRTRRCRQDFRCRRGRPRSWPPPRSVGISRSRPRS